MTNDTTTPKETNAAKQETGGGWMRRLVVPLRWVAGTAMGGLAMRKAAHGLAKDTKHLGSPYEFFQ
jgi:hypothetical protein